VKQMPQPYLSEEGILCWNMAAAEHYEITVGDHAIGSVDTGSVQNLIAAESNADFCKGRGGNGSKLAGACVILGIGGHKDYVGIVRQTAPDPVNKAVGIA